MSKLGVGESSEKDMSYGKFPLITTDCILSSSDTNAKKENWNLDIFNYYFVFIVIESSRIALDRKLTNGSRSKSQLVTVGASC
jgi:hypothetical protein